MTPEARRFYLRYYLLTRLLPIYAVALLCYGAAALCKAWGGIPGIICAVIQAIPLAVILVTALPYRLGLRWCGLGHNRQMEGTPAYAQVSEALGGVLEWLPLSLHTQRLGPVHFMAYEPDAALVLWVSEHTLDTLDPLTLRAVVLHEAGHRRESLSCVNGGFAWGELLWLLVFPLVWLLSLTPLLLLGVALLHAWIWLHLQQWLREGVEAAADRWAAERMGRLEYAATLSSYLAHFEQGASTRLRRFRLSGMGLTTAEIDALLA